MVRCCAGGLARRLGVLLFLATAGAAAACGNGSEEATTAPADIVIRYASAAFQQRFEFPRDRGRLERFLTDTESAATRGDLDAAWKAIWADAPAPSSPGPDYLRTQVYSRAIAATEWPSGPLTEYEVSFVTGVRKALIAYVESSPEFEAD